MVRSDVPPRPIRNPQLLARQPTKSTKEKATPTMITIHQPDLKARVGAEKSRDATTVANMRREIAVAVIRSFGNTTRSVFTSSVFTQRQRARFASVTE